MRALCATTAFLASLLLYSTVRAETGVPWDTRPPCADVAGAMLPKELPANVPGLPVQKTTGALIKLLAADGTEISRTVELRGSMQVLLVPGPLTVGATYSVAWTADCGSGAVSFLATAPKPLPTTAGTLVAEDPYFSEPFGKYRCDAEHRPIGLTTAPVRFEPSPELVPFLGIADVDTWVDGKTDPYAWPGPGQLLTPSRLSSPTLSCPNASQFRRVSARVTVAGMAPLDTSEVVLSLRCPAAVPAERCEPLTTDAGPLGDGGYGATDGGLHGDDVSTDSGCSTGGNAGLGLFSWLAIGAVSLTVARTTRRRR